MPVVTAGTVMRLLYQGTVNSQRTQTGFFWRADSVVGNPDWLESINALDTQINLPVIGMIPRMLLCLPMNWSEFGRVWQIVHPSLTAPITTVFGNSGLGIATQAQNTCAAITKRSSFAGRRNRGSWRLVSPDIGSVATGGNLQALYRTSLGAFATAAITSINVAVTGGSFTATPVIFHPGDPAQPTPITNFLVQATARVQQRRTTGVGQ